jgi:hypothetical protein
MNSKLKTHEMGINPIVANVLFKQVIFGLATNEKKD